MGARLRVVLLTGRFGLLRPLSSQELSDGRDQPSSPPHDRGHDGPQPLAGDATILRPRGIEVQPVFGRSPDTLSLEDVRTYQVHLASKGVAWASLNQAVAALRFFYGITLGMAEIPERIAYAREPRRLPVVLSADEVVRFLEAVPSLKARAALTTAYAAGLRVSEVTGLRVSDIVPEARLRHDDSGRMMIRIEPGQGRQGALRDAVGAAPGDPSHLLATGASRAVAVSGA